MPFDVQVIRACEFVRMGARGEFDLAGTREVVMALASACHKRGLDRALIDVRGATSNLTAQDLAELVRVFSKAVSSKRLRLAILHTGDQQYRAKLFAFFSAMRGRKVRAVENFDEGLAWLSNADDLPEKNHSPEHEVPIQSGKRSRTKIMVHDAPSNN